ncbi:MAG: Crp/Fnr family transcriptional regulator [Saprospiraceae bacterium]|nr:Crp/Fnr family transcriptional regulator [Candidatus Brachybacter algidus]
MFDNSIFSILSDTQVIDLNAHKYCTVFRKGQVLFAENAMPVGLFCIHSGKVKLSTQGIDGKEQIMRLAKSGEIIGYRALVSNERYHLSAIALEDCSACVIDKAFFMDLAMQEPRIAQQIFKLISNDLKKAEDKIISLSQKNVRERMAETLLFIKATYGMEEDNKSLNVRLTREELADYIGTSTESVIRLLSEFNAAGIISLEGKKILILEHDKLVRTANISY